MPYELRNLKVEILESHTIKLPNYNHGDVGGNSSRTNKAKAAYKELCKHATEAGVP